MNTQRMPIGSIDGSADAESAALEIVMDAVAEINRLLPEDRQLPADPVTPLLGSRATLDSLELVQFLAIVEQHARRRWATPITLTDDAAWSATRSPFRSLTALAGFLLERRKELEIQGPNGGSP